MSHNTAHAISALGLFAAAFISIDAVHVLEDQFGAFCTPALASAALATMCMGWGGYCLIQIGRANA